MASVWKLPVVFVCSNNGYAEHTRLGKSTSVANVSHRGPAYGTSLYCSMLRDVTLYSGFSSANGST